MAQTWQIQEARDKFSEIIEQAIQEGPQVVTRRGKETAVVLSYEDYRRLALSQKKLSAFFRESPLVGVELDLARDKSHVREDLVL
jgi:prevent-host-death family protein